MKSKSYLVGLALLLVTLLCVGLTACGGDTPAETTPETTPATETPTEIPTEEPTEEPTISETELPTEAPTEVPTEPSIKDQLGLEVNMSDLDQLMQPIFGGTVSVNETVMFLDYGDVKSLLYPIESIVSVTSFDGTKVYEEGKDYVIEDGKLKITEDSSIPCITREKFYNVAPHELINVLTKYEGKDVYTYWGEGRPMTDYQVNVNYTHADAWEGYTQPAELENLQGFVKKLQAGEDVTVMFYGDSITYGASATYINNYAPYQDSYPMLVVKALADLFDYTVHFEAAGLAGTSPVPSEDYVAGDRGTITYVNPAVGGWTTQMGFDNMDDYVMDKIEAHGCDLFVVGFGMNDGINPQGVSRTVQKILQRLWTADDDISVVIVSTMVPNPDATNGWYGQQDQQEIFLEKIAENFRKDGRACVVAHMTSVSKAVLEHKDFHDYSGNNINHPNDYFVRVYAQTLIQTIIGYENMD